MAYESIIRDQLATDLNLIEPGLTLIRKEYPLPNAIGCKGFIDILATDIFNNYVIIEIKRSKESSRQTLQEILKYIGLIKLNFGAKDSEIRSIIVSTNWEELYTPYCELTEDRSISIKGYKALLMDNNKISHLDQVEPIKLSGNRRRIGKAYSLLLYKIPENRNSAVDQLIKKSAKENIKDYVILSISHETKTFNDMHYGVVYACNQLSIDRYLDILQNLEYLEQSDGDFEDEKDYIRYLHECLIVLITDNIRSEAWDDGSPEKLDQAVTNYGWIVEGITRSGLFKNDPRLTDEMLLAELRGLTGHNRHKYTHFGSSLQAERIRELRENCILPFKYFPRPIKEIHKIFDFFTSRLKEFRIGLTTFCPASVFDGAYRYMQEDELGYLPIYSIFIDMIDEPLLYHFQGMLRWTGKKSNMEALYTFCETEDAETIFNKPIDIIQGIYDEKMLRLMELKWEVYGLMISDDKIEKEGIVTFSKTGNMSWGKLRSESVLRWSQAHADLKKYLQALYHHHTNNIQ